MKQTEENFNGTILKNGISDIRKMIRELNTMFKANNIPVFMAVYNPECQNVIYETTLPEEVNVNDVQVIRQFNKFLRDCTDF